MKLIGRWNSYPVYRDGLKILIKKDSVVIKEFSEKSEMENWMKKDGWKTIKEESKKEKEKDTKEK